ncbi:hypothetical protein BpHYR1_035110 [Brachionus plicatilis]|uniref:Uncharacterized protein n=1 Tax=Brachionus plicatilis TaxID=10195 RepID=A0A3M7RJ17_BRAPC|nr:hypothetical protein BpHYR1_035110 [Brachionus plicatilis]
MLNKHPNTNCIYNEIRWTEGDREKSVKCLDERDEENSKQLRLEHLRELLIYGIDSGELWKCIKVVQAIKMS